jgi:hypothetical protein
MHVPCILHLVSLVEKPIDISTVGGKQKHMQVHARSGSDRQSCSMNELKSNVNDKKHLLLGKEEDPAAILACYRRSALLCSSHLSSYKAATPQAFTALISVCIATLQRSDKAYAVHSSPLLAIGSANFKAHIQWAGPTGAPLAQWENLVQPRPLSIYFLLSFILEHRWYILV